MARGTIHQTIDLLQRAITQLGAELPPGQVEKIGVMVNKAMSVQGRTFHTPEHVLALADRSNPHITLAALFHDIVYFHVDEGFLPEIKEILEPYLSANAAGDLTISRGISRKDRAFWGTCAVFGFNPGDVLNPFSGMNEFLSALVMNKLLVGLLKDQDLFITTPCIEATIPFRPTTPEGKSPAEVLAERLKRINVQFELSLPESGIDTSVQCAVQFANRDVMNFAEEDVARFLDNTWKLLPETNPALRHQGIYTIGHYRHALQKMLGFLTGLEPQRVFSQYKGEPSDEKYQRLLAGADRNLKTARDYLGIKLVTAVILEAFAMATGGDAPISLFLGDLDPHGPGGNIEDYLPEVSKDKKPKDDRLFALLSEGRANESYFDLKNSPLSCFIYQHLGIEECRVVKSKTEELIAGSISPEGFLAGLPREMVSAVASAIGTMAWTRKAALDSLMARLRS